MFFNDISSIIFLVGCLRLCYSEWEKIGIGKIILDIIKLGYKILFKINFFFIELNNNRLVRDELEFVIGEIRNLIEKGCVLWVREKFIVVNFLMVVKNRNGKWRLVLDCRYVNFYLYKFKFRYEDVVIVKEMFKMGDFMFIFDLKLVYYYIEIYEEYW